MLNVTYQDCFLKLITLYLCMTVQWNACLSFFLLCQSGGSITSLKVLLASSVVPVLSTGTKIIPVSALFIPVPVLELELELEQ